GGGPVMGEPPSASSPEVAGRRPARQRSSVVLPAPEGPTTQTSSPGRTSNVRSATASTGSPRPAYTLRRWRTSRLAPPGWSTTSWSGATSAGLVMSGTSVLGLPVPEVPAQDRVRHDAEDEGQQHAHDAEQEDPAPHLRDREAALELDDREAQTVLGREHLADDHEDDPDRKS